MSVYLYDEALVTKLQSLFSKVIVTPYEKAFKKSGSQNSDQVKLPLITIHRTTPYSIIQETSSFRRKMGGVPVKSDAEGNLTSIQSIPIKITWQIDVWTRNRRQCDDICRDLVMYFSENPELIITAPYGLEVEFVFNVSIEPDIEDNSDLTEFDDKGQFYRSTIIFTTEEGMLFKANNGPTYKDVDINYYSNNNEVNNDILKEEE